MSNLLYDTDSIPYKASNGWVVHELKRIWMVVVA
jgi:hypothetical protein